MLLGRQVKENHTNSCHSKSKAVTGPKAAHWILEATQASFAFHLTILFHWSQNYFINFKVLGQSWSTLKPEWGSWWTIPISLNCFSSGMILLKPAAHSHTNKQIFDLCAYTQRDVDGWPAMPGGRDSTLTSQMTHTACSHKDTGFRWLNKCSRSPHQDVRGRHHTHTEPAHPFSLSSCSISLM